MSSCVKSFRPKSRHQGFNPSYAFIFLSWYHFFLIFASFFKLNLKNQTTIDEHRHTILVILVILVFSMAISQVET
jgi:uncharacterized membrane protein (DUF485 family)